MTNVERHILRMRYVAAHPDVALASVFVCDHCERAYVLRYQEGASKEHCSSHACHLAHDAEIAQRNRINSRIRMRLIRGVG